MKRRNVPPCWTGYVAVPDTDACVKKVVAAGGKLHRPAADIPGVGRFALVTDPHGAAFFLFTPMGENPNPPPAPGTPGHIGWHELYTDDLESAFKFYSKLFGWTKSTAVDMGPMGTYQLFAINGEDKGGMMKKPPHIPVATWGYYFNVAALDAALGRVTKKNGLSRLQGHGRGPCLDRRNRRWRIGKRHSDCDRLSLRAFGHGEHHRNPAFSWAQLLAPDIVAPIRARRPLRSRPGSRGSWLCGCLWLGDDGRGSYRRWSEHADTSFSNNNKGRPVSGMRLVGFTLFNERHH
jgi:predicted enzyme related to lactoylglutathione lyase